MRIDPERVRAKLDTAWLGRTIVYSEETASTNADAKLIAKNGAENGALVLCSRQTAGRGRRGRSWLSDDGALCFTLILRPAFPMELAPRYVIACAVGVCGALRSLGADAYIKWPNDILCSGYKVCGILCEADASGFVAAGIGINVAQRSFPADIADTAGSLFTSSGLELPAEDVLSAVLSGCEAGFEQCEHDYGALLSAYAGMSCTLGRRVLVIGADSSFEGVAVELDALGRLLVRDGAGELRTVNAGDVSLRPAR